MAFQRSHTLGVWCDSSYAPIVDAADVMKAADVKEPMHLQSAAVDLKTRRIDALSWHTTAIIAGFMLLTILTWFIVNTKHKI